MSHVSLISHFHVPFWLNVRPSSDVVPVSPLCTWHLKRILWIFNSMSLQQQVQQYVEGAQGSIKKLPDQIKAGKVDLQELFFLITAYLGMFSLCLRSSTRCVRCLSRWSISLVHSALSASIHPALIASHFVLAPCVCSGGFGVLAFLLPSLGTTAYGGDGHPGTYPFPLSHSLFMFIAFVASPFMDRPRLPLSPWASVLHGCVQSTTRTTGSRPVPCPTSVWRCCLRSPADGPMVMLASKCLIHQQLPSVPPLMHRWPRHPVVLSC